MEQASTAESKYMATVKLGPKGQILIPKEVRELYGLRPGDTLLLLADQDRGLALLPQEKCQKLYTLLAQIFPRSGPT